MNENEKTICREFVIDLIKELFLSTRNFDHLDAYAGATFAIDLEESMENLLEKGWKLTKEEVGG